MRIDELVIDGFGRWTDLRLSPAPGLTVIRGANEAGKTTLLAFIRSVLFGFRTGEHPALRGGRRGGTLAVTTADERHFRIERHGERGGAGTLRVVGEDGVDRGAAYLTRLLRGVEESVYRNVFAFRLDELAELRALEGDQIAARIYGAGLGTGAASALAVENALRAERASLFRSGGQLPRINAFLRELEEVDARLAASDPATEHRERADHLTQLEARLDRLAAGLPVLVEQRARLQRQVAAWPHWLALRDAMAAIAALDPVEPLPEGALERFERLEESLRDADAGYAGARAHREALDIQLASLPPERGLLAIADRIRPLLDARASDRGRAETLRRLTADAQAAGSRATAAVARLGPGWNESRILEIETSVGVRSAVTGRFRTLLESASRDVVRSEDRLAGEERSVTEARAELRLIPELSPGKGHGAIGERDRQLRRLETALAERHGLRAVAGVAARPPIDGRLLIAAVAVAAGVLAGVAILALGAGWLLAAVAAMLGMAGAAVARSRRPAHDAATRPSRLAELDTTVRSLGTALGLGSDPAPDAIERALTELDARRADEHRAAAATERRAELKGRVMRLSTAHDAARTALDEARQRAETADTEWRGWLRRQGLDERLDRESALAVLDAVEAARTAIADRDELRQRVASLESERREFADEVSAVLADLGRGQAADHVATLDRLEDELDGERRDAERRSHLLERHEEAHAREAALSAQRDALVSERAALLEACRAEDGDELRRRATVGADRRRHQAQADLARAALKTLSGPAAAFDALVAQLESIADVADVAAELAGVEAGLSSATEERDELNRHIGALRAEVAALEASADASEERQRAAGLVARIGAEAEQWSVLALAVGLLERTRRRYELEHRPAVIAAAESFLADWTAGRYRRIVAPLGSQIEGLETADGRRVPLGGLSRGTAEQLYLALRLGLVEHFADEAEPLPIAMDEILVNFDPDRAARAARSIEALARRHQVLYLTCRDDVALAGELRVDLDALAGGA